MSGYKVDFNALQWETPMGGLRYKAERRSGRQLRLVEYTRDMKPHWCENGHAGYVLEGTFEIAFDDEVAVFKPGDGIFIPPGKQHRHQARVLTDKVSVIFVEDV